MKQGQCLPHFIHKVRGKVTIVLQRPMHLGDKIKELLRQVWSVKD